MAEVFLGLGSNVQRYRHLAAGLDALQQRFGALRCSPVYESEAVGFVGDPFLNMVVAVDTPLALADLVPMLREIEYAHGRQADAPKYSPRSLDIDILSYDDFCGLDSGLVLPRDEILSNAFVLLPLSELAPGHCHPQTGKSYAEHWRDYSKGQVLRRVEFHWQQRCLSRAS